MTNTSTSSKWYNNKLIVTLLCIFFFPVGLYALWKNEYIAKGWKIGVTALLAILVIPTLIPESGNKDDSISYSESKTDNNSAAVKEEPEKSEEDTDAELKERLTNEINANTKKEFDGSVFRGGIKSIQSELVAFSTWAILIKDAENSKDEEIKKLGEKLKARATEIQVSEFPKMRKDYRDYINESLSTLKVETKIKGKGNTRIEFVGTAFENKEMEKLAQKNVVQMLEFLRFEKSIYKTSKYDNSPTSYTINTQKDNKVFVIK